MENLKLCPVCHQVASWNSYFSAWVCHGCGYQWTADKVKKDNTERWNREIHVPSHDKTIENIFDVIESALANAGYTIMDGDATGVIIRHKASDTDYLISINEEN